MWFSKLSELSTVSSSKLRLHPDERQIRGVADQGGEAAGAQGAPGVLQEGHLFPRSLHLAGKVMDDIFG